MSSPNCPFISKPFYRPEKIEKVCRDALKEHDLLPVEPSPVRIERLLEKRWDISEQYLPLGDGITGFAGFSEEGLVGVAVNIELAEDQAVPARRRVRSTLAHEIGHGLFHEDLWKEVFENRKQPSLFDEKEITYDGFTDNGFLCRTNTVEATKPINVKNEWWEFQANKAMASLLLPSHLVAKALEPYQNLLMDKNAIEQESEFEKTSRSESI